MKQTLLHPRPDLTLLGVIVKHKLSFGFKILSSGTLVYCGKMNRICTKIERFNSKDKYTIIGLVSQITEEQAKELVNKSMNYNSRNGYVGIEQYQSYKDPIIYYNTAIAALESLIETSGLTVTKEEDVLLIKKN